MTENDSVISENLKKINHGGLSYLCIIGYQKAVKTILEENRSTQRVNAETINQALVRVVARNNFNCLQMTELLISYGADINFKDRNNSTALDYALENSAEEVINYLLEVQESQNNTNMPLWDTVPASSSVSSSDIDKKMDDFGCDSVEQPDFLGMDFNSDDNAMIRDFIRERAARNILRSLDNQKLSRSIDCRIQPGTQISGGQTEVANRILIHGLFKEKMRLNDSNAFNDLLFLRR